MKPTEGCLDLEVEPVNSAPSSISMFFLLLTCVQDILIFDMTVHPGSWSSLSPLHGVCVCVFFFCVNCAELAVAVPIAAKLGGFCRWCRSQRMALGALLTPCLVSHTARAPVFLFTVHTSSPSLFRCLPEQ